MMDANAKDKVRLYGFCPDCHRPLLPKPRRVQDDCSIRPLVCANCREEKFIIDIVILKPKPDDRFARTAGAS